jgi:hypothetical protein
MLKEMDVFRLCCVEGEVMIHDGRSGWLRGEPGMEIPCGDRVAIKTGGGGRCEVADRDGKRFSVESDSLYVIGEARDPDLVDTLPRVSMEVGPKRTRARLMQRLVPVV